MASASERPRVLLTGATGFVGNALFPVLVRAGYRVRCGARDPDRAKLRWPAREWVHTDVDDPRCLGAALYGCDAAFYLVHGMRGGRGDYDEREARAARAFAEAAGREGLRRVVYLGGMLPKGPPSRHLASRIETGHVLRNAFVGTVELRASMIVGAGSESWKITRDLATRLPALPVPRWLDSRTEPIATCDVLAALLRALTLEDDEVGVYDAPGPEALSGREILERVARLQGIAPRLVSVPLVAPRFAGFWIDLVTRAEPDMVRELVFGLTSDVLARDEGIWRKMPGYTRTPFDDAARMALLDDEATLPWSTRLVESAIRKVARRPAEGRAS